MRLNGLKKVSYDNFLCHEFELSLENEPRSDEFIQRTSAKKATNAILSVNIMTKVSLYFLIYLKRKCVYLQFVFNNKCYIL